MADATEEPLVKKIRLEADEGPTPEPGDPMSPPTNGKEEEEETATKVDQDVEAGQRHAEEADDKETNAAEGKKEREVRMTRVDLCERRPEEVGMTESLGQHRGFHGVVKNRWEDFLVHEVATDGRVARLTSLDLPEADQQRSQQADLADDALFSDEDRAQLDKVVSGDLDSVALPAPECKEARTKLHVTIKQRYPNLMSNTESRPDLTRVIMVRSNKAPKGPVRSDRPNRTCEFVLHKKGRDTGDSISLLCSLLKSHPKHFSFSGNKDRRGVTSQFVTAFRISAESLKNLNSTLRGIKLGNFRYLKKSLQLGDLRGNQFTIVIREVEGEESEIATAFQSLKENGFINYFGLQRFGTSAIASHEIGLAIIRSQWERAIDLILEPQPTDLPVVRNLKLKYKEDRNAKAALAGMSDHVSRSLLHGIARHGRGLKALMELPRQLRQLYIHSTQSLLWNRLASRRLREFGARVRPGDLFIRKECLEHRIKTPNAIVEVTEANLDDVSLYDVVLPLPGYDITFGTGIIHRWYQELLLELDLTEEQFKHEIRDFSAAGTYRPVFVRPTDVSFYTHLYDDPERPLVASDWELLSDPALASAPPSLEGQHKAVVVKFELPKSSYATVAIREAMRTVRIKK